MDNPFANFESQLALLAAVVESSNDAIITKDLEGIITSWNRGAQNIFGYTREEAIGQPVTMLMPPERRNEEPGILERIRRGESVGHYETVRQRKDGTLIDISLTISPLRNSRGEIFGASKVARDITHRKRTHGDLARLAAIVETSDDAIITKDLNGIITSWNRGAEQIFGYTAEEAIGQSITMLMPEDRTDEEPEILNRIRNGERVDHYETVRCRKDGTRVNISLSVSPLYDESGQVVGTSKIARDITERLRAYEAMRQKETMERIVAAQEAERNRIARDLHDHLGQKVTGLRLMVGTLLERCGGYGKQSGELEGLKDLAAQIDQDVGFLSWELRPTEVEVVGLPDAMNSFVREWSKQYKIKADFHYNGQTNEVAPPVLPRDVETHLYRILQESLNNVLKYAEAENVNVVLGVRTHDIMLTVEDDGVGFDLAEAEARRQEGRNGFGLVGMSERAELMRGRLNIDTSPGRGTTLVISVPRETVKRRGPNTDSATT